ncbi:MAG: hypothetical protein HC803_01000 [Saprospiraceae bacterium]|nr:hypothetical protein [Saprospiraceae bacterium]
MPIISQTILENDTATIPLADAFRANELLQTTENEEKVVYTFCNGLGEDKDLGVGFSKIDSLGNLIYTTQDTGKVRSCVTMAFELRNKVTIVDTVLVEINVEQRIITEIDEPIAITEPKVENILSLRPYPVKRNIEELAVPEAKGWAKAYLNFENNWWVWMKILIAFAGIFYFLAVGLLSWLYFRKGEKLIHFKKAILTIPYKVNLPFTNENSVIELIKKRKRFMMNY